MVGRRSIWEQDDDGEDMVRSSLWGPPPRQKKKKRVRPAFISRIDKKSVSIWWMERCRGRVGVAGPAAALIYESKAWQRDRGGWRGAGGDLFCAEDHHLRAKRGAQRKKAWGSLFRFFPMQKETLIKEKAGKKQFQQTHSGYLIATYIHSRAHERKRHSGTQ